VAKAKDNEDEVVKAAFDAQSQVDLVQLIKELPPEHAAYYVAKLEAAYKKRKLQLSGYLVALVAWLISMVLALGYFGANEGFTGWVFLLPFGIVGLTLWVFGRWAEVVGKSVGEPPADLKQVAKTVTGKSKKV
jgi:hypothetical protein